MRNNNKIVRAGLASAVSLATVLGTGCTTMQPVYDSQGRYLGEQEKPDPGRTVEAIGFLVGGPLGLLTSASGSKASQDQRQRVNEIHRLNSQRQIDKLAMMLEKIQNGEVDASMTQPMHADFFDPGIQDESTMPPYQMCLSAESGVAPLFIKYASLAPRRLREGATFLWTINGKETSRTMFGENYLGPGDNLIKTVMTTQDNKTYAVWKTVTVVGKVSADASSN